MRYIGGKHRIAKLLAGSILPHVRDRRLIEPFCGGMSATVALQPQFVSDACSPLIRLINSVRGGWEPPAEVSEQMYQEALGGDHNNPLTFFILQGNSYGGKWRGGYARDARRNATGDSTRALIRKVGATMSTIFTNACYWDWTPGPGDVFYCDPPYRGVTNGYATGPFDSDAFWDWVRDGAQRGALMFVSEFQGPDWATVHVEYPSRTDLRKREGGEQKTVEKLYIVGDLT